jgi:hypothetical protein
MKTLLAIFGITILFSFLHPAWAAETEIPMHMVPQNAPCPNQATSLVELKRLFDKASAPSPKDISGSWVAIGFFSDRGPDKRVSFACDGLLRGDKYEASILAKGYSAEMYNSGTKLQDMTLEPDSYGSLSFPVNLEGDAQPVYRCRIIAKKTLVCLVDIYGQGWEFKKLPIDSNAR